MNKMILFVSLLFLFAGCGEKKTNSVIQGVWNRGKVEKLYLFRVENGSLRGITPAVPDEEGHFSFDFEPEYEGFYVVGPHGTFPLNNYTFYLKPGDDLQFTVNETGYELTGENTPENKAIAAWDEYIFPVRDAAFNYSVNKMTWVDFFPLVEQKLEGMASLDKKPTGNKKFNDAFEKYKTYDFMYDAFFFLFSPRNAFPEPADMISYYTQPVLTSITTTEDILSYPYGMALVNVAGMQSINNTINNLPEEQRAEARRNVSQIDFVLPEIVNDKIKGEFLNMHIVRVTSYDKVKEYREKYNNYLVTDAQQETFQNYMDELGRTAAGNPAIDFKFPDMDGNEVALSDFKGKVVYIDVWATWCGPCKQEIPHLKNLEKEYHGKDIVFMSVSTDAGKDEEKWRQMVIKEELKGVQLFAGDRSREEIINPYRIKGIPRFILIDKNGNILSNDAERPSAENIREVLDAALAR